MAPNAKGVASAALAITGNATLSYQGSMIAMAPAKESLKVQAQGTFDLIYEALHLLFPTRTEVYNTVDAALKSSSADAWNPGMVDPKIMYVPDEIMVMIMSAPIPMPQMNPAAAAAQEAEDLTGVPAGTPGPPVMVKVNSKSPLAGIGYGV